MVNTIVNLKQSQESMFHVLRDMSIDPFYTDADLHCEDATVSYSRFLAGFIFPQLAASEVFHCPIQCTLILPDYSVQEVHDLLERKLMDFESEQSNICQIVAERVLDHDGLSINSPHMPTNFEMDFAQKFHDPRRFDEFQQHETNFYLPNSTAPQLQQIVQHNVHPISIVETSIHTESNIEKVEMDKKLKSKRTGKKFNIKISPTGEKLFMCFYCDYISIDHSHVKRHERTHTGEKPFVCLQCGKKFGQLSAKMRHEKTHTGDKPFKCRYCGKSFSRQHGMMGHERLHTGEKPFFCNFCHEKFTTTREKKRHEKRIHSDSKHFTLKHEFQNIIIKE